MFCFLFSHVIFLIILSSKPCHFEHVKEEKHHSGKQH